MQIITKFKNFSNINSSCIALGTFDGVHKGHQRLMEVMKKYSTEFKAKSIVYTFSNHPRKLINPEKSVKIITDNSTKAQLIKKMDIDILYFEEFKNIMNMDAESFVSNILINRFKVKCVVVGYNYKFGYDGKGNTETLKYYGDKYGFKVEIIPAVEIEKQIVSSSLIRYLIENGEVNRILTFLGRTYSIEGNVIDGKKNGTTMGIKTANIKVNEDIIIPKLGVYITDTIINNLSYRSVTNIGFNPTFKGEKISIETHILGFDNSIYDKTIKVLFHKFIRDEIAFNTTQELINQISKDIKLSKGYNV